MVAFGNFRKRRGFGGLIKDSKKALVVGEMFAFGRWCHNPHKRGGMHPSFFQKLPHSAILMHENGKTAASKGWVVQW